MTLPTTVQPRNILIVKLSAIGDVIHTLPSLTALRRLYPQAHITWVVEEAAADIIQGASRSRSRPCLPAQAVAETAEFLKNTKSITCGYPGIHKNLAGSAL